MLISVDWDGPWKSAIAVSGLAFERNFSATKPLRKRGVAG